MVKLWVIVIAFILILINFFPTDVHVLLVYIFEEPSL